MQLDENEMDLLEFTFISKLKKKKAGIGCPYCGDCNVVVMPTDNKRNTYGCGYSQGHPNGDTPCMNQIH